MEESNPSSKGDSRQGRPYLSVLFACCQVYVRIYRAADGSGYQGRCPQCGKPVKFAVGADGTTARTFVVS
jgi:PHP family Zn ribbon phosphoesterase